MPISSVIIKTEKGQEWTLANTLKTLPYIEVQEIGIEHLIVTTDTTRIEEDRMVTESLSSFEGVRSAYVVYTNMEDCIE